MYVGIPGSSGICGIHRCDGLNVSTEDCGPSISKVRVTKGFVEPCSPALGSEGSLCVRTKGHLKIPVEEEKKGVTLICQGGHNNTGPLLSSHCLLLPFLQSLEASVKERAGDGRGRAGWGVGLESCFLAKDAGCSSIAARFGS